MSEADTAVLLANSLVSNAVLNESNNWLIVLGNEGKTLEAIKSADNLTLSACLHVEGLDKALSEIDGTVLLADTNLRLDYGGSFVMVMLVLNLDGLEAFKCA